MHNDKLKEYQEQTPTGRELKETRMSGYKVITLRYGFDCFAVIGAMAEYV